MSVSERPIDEALGQQHQADSVLLNSLVWAILEQLNLVEPADSGRTSHIADTVNRDTLVSDMIDRIKVAMQAEYDRGYWDGCHDCY